MLLPMWIGPKLLLATDPTHQELFSLWHVRAIGGLALALGASLHAVLARVESRRRGMIALFVWQLLAIFGSLIEYTGAYYTFVTGELIDYSMLLQIMEPRTRAMVSNLMPPFTKAIAAFCVCSFLALPWFWVWRGAPPRMPTLRARTWAGIALVGLVIALLPLHPKKGRAAAFSRSATLTLISEADRAFAGDFSPRKDLRAGKSLATIERAEDRPQRDIVFFFMESTRHEALGAYNPTRRTSPVFDALARESTLYENMFVPIPSTSKALVSTLCGIYPAPITQFSSAFPGRLPQRCLPELLGEMGYASMFMRTSWGMVQQGLPITKNTGFQTSLHREDIDRAGFQELNGLGWEDLAMVEPSRAWIRSIPKEQRIMMAYLSVAPHANYDVPEGWLGAHDEDEKFNRYLSDLHYVDHVIGEIITMLKEEGRWENTVLVMLGDHGQAFGSHDIWYHGTVMYEEGVHIPLLIHEPWKAEARRVEEPVSQLDILPTVIRLSGHELQGGDYHGLDVEEATMDRPLDMFCWVQQRCMARIEWPYKYIDNFDLREPELYDISKDPYERDNLYKGPTPQTEAMKAALEQRLKALHILHELDPPP